MTVTLECGPAEVLYGVDEPEKCTYAATLSTPAACDGTAAQELRLELEGHDEL